MTGLRERKKQRTRDALILAAHELFVTQGYDATTVDQITEAVEVSQRTFFRYFSNKEDVALALQQMFAERFFAALSGRPLDEAPMDALRHTLEVSWGELGPAIEEIVPLDLHMRMWQVIEVTPALLAAHLRQSLVLEERLAAEIARRTGLDPESDPRPRVLVAAFCAVMGIAGRHWAMRGNASLEEARRVIKSYVDHLTPALSANWDDRGA
ncbi:TetR/AcrR family transcriptional regulator [Streptomyces sp. NPDC048172]|uniref:TetR/AcrR family transcriptional regulator n=1 Tax=Streptomyces sp. NPDC048172 TaxID=3365505 RepID=UPI0037126298